MNLELTKDEEKTFNEYYKYVDKLAFRYDDDVKQEAYIGLIFAIKNYKIKNITNVNLRGYIIRTVKLYIKAGARKKLNVSNYYRSKFKNMNEYLEPISLNITTADSKLELINLIESNNIKDGDKDLFSIMYKSIYELDENERRIYIMYNYENMTVREIADTFLKYNMSKYLQSGKIKKYNETIKENIAVIMEKYTDYYEASFEFIKKCDNCQKEFKTNFDYRNYCNITCDLKMIEKIKKEIHQQRKLRLSSKNNKKENIDNISELEKLENERNILENKIKKIKDKIRKEFNVKLRNKKIVNFIYKDNEIFAVAQNEKVIQIIENFLNTQGYEVIKEKKEIYIDSNIFK